MAAAGIAIELPTNRHSRYFDGPVLDVHDPDYIPVLNEAEIKVDFGQPSFSALPSIPTLHKNASQTSLKRSKSGSAPETVVHSPSSSAHRVPSQRTAASKNAPPRSLQEIASSYDPMRDNGYPTSSSEDDRTESSEASTMGAFPSLEEQVFVVPGNAALKVDEIQFPAVPHSARSSISSSKNSFVPTSRYNKKQPSLRSVPPSAFQPHRHTKTPLSPRGASPELNLIQQQQQHFQQQTLQEAPRATPSPMISPSMEASPAASPVSTPRMQPMKFTASERRARALHSHPSNLSLKSKRTSIGEEPDEMPLMLQATITNSRASSTRSRSQSICNSTQPTPAPDVPLPELPPSAKRPPTRERPRTTEKPIEKPAAVHNPNTPSTFLSPPLSAPTNDRVEMAKFMTTRKTTVFRRFDEVHVRLVLHLQDKISALEKELLETEEAGPGRPDTVVRKANVMGELRKVLAGYGEYPQPFLSLTACDTNTVQMISSQTGPRCKRTKQATKRKSNF